MYQMLSQSVRFCELYIKNIMVCFSVHSVFYSQQQMYRGPTDVVVTLDDLGVSKLHIICTHETLGLERCSMVSN